MTELPFFTGKTGIKWQNSVKSSGTEPSDTQGSSAMAGYGELLA